MIAITDLPPEMIAAKLKLEAISLLMIKCTVLLTAKIHIMVPWEISLNITDTFPSMLKMKKFRWTHEEIVTKDFSSFLSKIFHHVIEISPTSCDKSAQTRIISLVVDRSACTQIWTIKALRILETLVQELDAVISHQQNTSAKKDMHHVT